MKKQFNTSKKRIRQKMYNASLKYIADGLNIVCIYRILSHMHIARLANTAKTGDWSYNGIALKSSAAAAAATATATATAHVLLMYVFHVHGVLWTWTGIASYPSCVLLLIIITDDDPAFRKFSMSSYCCFQSVGIKTGFFRIYFIKRK